jgi:hypothetical protein
MQPLIVHRLEIVCMSDCTRDPYGQPGCSAIIAYIFESDRAVFDEVRSAAGTSKSVAVRCGGLEVRGVVGEYPVAKNDPLGRVAIAVHTVHPHNAIAAGGAT